MVVMLLPSLFFSTVKAQEVLTLDLEKALEIALSENPTVKVADKEIEKKKYAQKGSYAALFPQVSFTADYTRTLKKQVMYMDGFRRNRRSRRISRYGKYRYEQRYRSGP